MSYFRRDTIFCVFQFHTFIAPRFPPVIQVIVIAVILVSPVIISVIPVSVILVIQVWGLRLGHLSYPAPELLGLRAIQSLRAFRQAKSLITQGRPDPRVSWPAKSTHLLAPGHPDPRISGPARSTHLGGSQIHASPGRRAQT